MCGHVKKTLSQWREGCSAATCEEGLRKGPRRERGCESWADVMLFSPKKRVLCMTRLLPTRDMTDEDGCKDCQIGMVAKETKHGTAGRNEA